MGHSDVVDCAGVNASGSGSKHPLGHVAAAAVISVARIVSRLTTRGVHIAWFDAWNSALDQALEALPAIPGCDRDLYRKLTQPTSVQKCHALATQNGRPIALISLRRRQTFWEPVTYQTLPGVIAPARSQEALSQALRALGAEVRIEAGLNKSVADLNPRSHWIQNSYRVDLRDDYEARWTRNHRSSVRRARNRCDAFMTQRIDGAGDLEWCVDQWQRTWENDAAAETVAAEDRKRFWPAFVQRQNTGDLLQFRTVQLLDGDRRTAGQVLMCSGDRVVLQCAARDPAYDEYSVGKRVLDSVIAWAAAAGFHYFDLGSGGDYKQNWGEPVAGRYGAIFRPRAIGALYRLGLL